MDIFLEKIVKRRKSAVDMLLASLIVTLSIVICFFVFAILGPGIAPLIIVGVIYLAWWLISKRNIEYEYSITNGDIDVDCIYNQRKRKRVFSANCKEFDTVAKVKSVQYTREVQETKNVLDFSSNDPNSDKWFIFLRREGKTTVVLFEPTAQMLENFRIFIPRKVFKD